MTQNKKSQRGFSLVEVLVVTGLMAILSVAMMTMVSDQNKANKSTQLTIEANEIYNRVQRYMLDSNTCGDTLNGLVVAPGGKRVITNIVKDGTTLITSDASGNQIGGLFIKSMEITRKTGALNLEFDFMLTLERVNKTSSIGTDTFARPMTLQAKFSPTVTNQIIGCFSQLESAVDTAVQESCDSLCPVTPVTVPSACWNVTTKKCSIPAPATARNLYMSSTGLTLTQPVPTAFSCSNCGSNCNPCPGGWTQLSNNCSRSSRQCGFSKWRNCNGTCINGSGTPVGKVFPP
jgi:prepilin-type N-terminal cleavage/methylation domain-containing protein